MLQWSAGLSPRSWRMQEFVLFHPTLLASRWHIPWSNVCVCVCVLSLSNSWARCQVVSGFVEKHVEASTVPQLQYSSQHLFLKFIIHVFFSSCLFRVEGICSRRRSINTQRLQTFSSLPSFIVPLHCFLPHHLPFYLISPFLSPQGTSGGALLSHAAVESESWISLDEGADSSLWRKQQPRHLFYNHGFISANSITRLCFFFFWKEKHPCFWLKCLWQRWTCKPLTQDAKNNNHLVTVQRSAGKLEVSAT